MADALVSKTSGISRESSNLSFGTKIGYRLVEEASRSEVSGDMAGLPERLQGCR